MLTGSAGNQIAAAKMFHVYGGDKVELSGYAYSIGHNGSGASNLSNFATVLLGAFQLTTPAPGETHTASAAISAEGVSAAAGYGEGSTDNTDVRAFFTILVFDKNFNLIDTKYQQVTNDSNWDLIDLTYTAQEECQIYAYISMEDGNLSDLYIDDVTITHTPTKVIQYNEYYPFGMQTDRSWTRGTGTANNFLSNGGTELNPASQLYDLGFRNLDPVLGRFHQVDPMADKYGSQNPYHYASNNPANLNDVSGLDPEGAVTGPWVTRILRAAMADAFGGGGVGVMNDNPDGIQNVSNSYYDNTPASMNVFNWFQPTTEQLVNSAFNNTPAGTNAFYSGNGTLLQSGYSGSITLQGGGPVIYNEYVDDYVPAYLITMNGGVNTNKELYERALRAISDWGAVGGQGDPIITGASVNTGVLSSGNNCVNCGFLKDGLGTNARPDLGYFNGAEIHFNVLGSLNGYKVSVSRNLNGRVYSNGQLLQSLNGSDGPSPDNVFVSGDIYSVDAPGVFSQAVNVTSGTLTFQIIGNFIETATILNANGDVVSQYSMQWSSNMQIGRSSPDGVFQYISGSIGPGHVNIH